MLKYALLFSGFYWLFRAVISISFESGFDEISVRLVLVAVAINCLAEAYKIHKEATND